MFKLNKTNIVLITLCVSGLLLLFSQIKSSDTPSSIYMEICAINLADERKSEYIHTRGSGRLAKYDLYLVANDTDLCGRNIHIAHSNTKVPIIFEFVTGNRLLDIDLALTIYYPGPKSPERIILSGQTDSDTRSVIFIPKEGAEPKPIYMK